MTNKNIFPVSKSTLSADALGKFIQKKYNLSNNVSCELIARGINDIYIVKANRKSYAARVLRSGARTKDQLSYEIELMLFYAKEGFHSPEPICSNDNKYFIPILAPEGERYLTLFNWVEGVLLSDNASKKNIYNFGKHIAQMHNINHKFKSRKKIHVDSSKYIKKYFPALVNLLNKKNDILFYEKLIQNACTTFDQIKKDTIPYGPTHSDIHFRNVFLMENNNFSLIDWDTCGNDFLIKELTSFTWLINYLEKPKKLNEYFMNGYKEERKFTKEEEELYPLFFCMRHLHIICGVSKSVNIIGHNIIGFNHSLENYKKLAVQAGLDAGLL